MGARGCCPTLLPLWMITDLDDGGAALRAACGTLSQYDWVIFTSQFAVDAVQTILAAAHVPWPKDVKVAAVGEMTAATLRRAGIVPTLVSPTSSVEGFVTLFGKTDVHTQRILLPQGTKVQLDLAQALRSMGVHVDTVTAYAVTPTPIDVRRWLRQHHNIVFDAVCFTAPSAVERFIELFGPAPRTVAPFAHCRWYAIGPTTAAVMQRLHFAPIVTATTPTFDALADRVAECLLRGIGATTSIP